MVRSFHMNGKEALWDKFVMGVPRPFGQILRDITRPFARCPAVHCGAMSREGLSRRGLCRTTAWSQPDAVSASSMVSVSIAIEAERPVHVPPRVEIGNATAVYPCANKSGISEKQVQKCNRPAFSGRDKWTADERGGQR